jgi:NAD(P)-dependent dehydrogenase (short-subunit alcohol dehydrogenase family)
MSTKGNAIVIGVGPLEGLGGALCSKIASEGLTVFAAGRTAASVEAVANALAGEKGRVHGVAVDATEEAGVARLFEQADAAGGPLDLVVYNVGNAAFGSFLDMETALFESVWRVTCLGGFLAGREAGRRMVEQGHGTILFTGASASLRGRPPFAAFASAKAALRSLAQTMARDLGPQGVHVGHVVIDGAIGGKKIKEGLPQLAERLGDDGMVGLEGLAEAYWALHVQPRNAWTHEIDVRPYKETW